MITLVTYASVGDTVGRYLAGWKDLLSKEHFFMTSLVRGVIFVVLFLLTNAGVSVFGSDWFIIISLGLFLITSGYWTTIGMKFGCDEKTGDQGLAGTLMGFHITLGISLGSVIAMTCLSN